MPFKFVKKKAGQTKTGRKFKIVSKPKKKFKLVPKKRLRRTGKGKLV